MEINVLQLSIDFPSLRYLHTVYEFMEHTKRIFIETLSGHLTPFQIVVKDVSQ